MSMLEPFPQWPRDANRLFGGEHGRAAFVPPVDVLVSDDGVSVYVDVPGVGRDRLEIDIENDVLTIRGERPRPTDDPGRIVRPIERAFGRFERSLRVPRGLHADAIHASLHDGVLTLRIPWSVTQQSRRVAIEDGLDVARASDSPELATAGSKT
jgi:HSP20 family protein